MSTAESSLTELLRILKILGAASDEQIGYLRKLSAPPVVDELGLEFDDIYPVTPVLQAEGLLANRQASAVAAVDKKLQEMSGEENKDLWTEAALRDSSEWAQVRNLAQLAAASLAGE